MSDPAREQEVDGMLVRAGLTVSADERARLIALYPQLREQLAALRVPEVRYAEPAVVYPAAERA